MHRRSSFWKPFGRECVSQSKKQPKSAEKYFYPTFPSFSANVSQKKSFSVRWKILGLLFNRLPANYQYSGGKTENLSLTIKTELPWKLTTFTQIFVAFLESILNLEHFQKKTQASQLKYYWSYWLQTTFLLICTKSLVYKISV